MARLMGITKLPPTGAANVAARLPINALPAGMESEIAAQLWSERLHTAIKAKLDDLASLDKQPHPVLLAATIPYDSMRAALVNSSANIPPRGQDLWMLSDGSTEWSRTRDFWWSSRYCRAKRPSRAKRSRRRARGIVLPRTPGTAATKQAEAAKKVQDKQSKEQAEIDWMTASSKLVTAWCMRLSAVAAANAKATAAAGQPAGETAAKLPEDFELDPNAKVVASCRLVWPDSLPAAVSQLQPSPLEINYFRIEETNKPKQAISYYGKQAHAKPADTRMIDKAVWIDALLPPSEKNQRRCSLDVLITRPVPKAIELRKDDAETDLVVEILSIEINDPGAKQ